GSENPVLTSFNELNEILDESITVVRRISWELTPEAFHYSGLSASIKKLCNRLDGKGQAIIFEENGGQLWNDDRALQVFRITQELINNALKHSGASRITVSLFWEEGNLKLKVVDDGSGLTINKDKNGVGLWNINHRLKQLDGKMSIGNPPMQTGTEVCI